MEEKTLNDEKLLNDIKNSIKISKDFRFNDTTIRIKDLEDILNLIYRLQNDIGGYVADQEIWFTRVKGLENEKAELQAEIERLTEVKEEVKQLKEYTDVLKGESEQLKQSCAEAVNSFIRMETLYKIKCNELEIANKKLEELKSGKID